MTDRKQKNDWEEAVDKSKLKETKDHDLKTLYKHAHDELSLQQNKRDQIITIYLALCSFLLPFALGEEFISQGIKGMIFLVLGVVGIMFSLIAIRYRQYKEIYWLCCQAITVLQGIKPEEIDKSVVQRTFYYCMKKKAKAFLNVHENYTRLKKTVFIKKNIFSSETFHFMIIDLMTSFIIGLGAFLLADLWFSFAVLIGICAGIAAFIILLTEYFGVGLRLYSALAISETPNDAQRRNRAFNSAFSKAWFLHIYY